MKTILAGLFVAALSMTSAPAVAHGQQPDNSPQTTEAASAELSEANRLNVAVVKLYSEDKTDEALPLAKKVLEIRERLLGTEHVQVGLALNNLARLYATKGKTGDAEKLLIRAQSIFEKGAGNELRLAETLETLALSKFKRGKRDEAVTLMERAVELKEITPGVSVAEVATPVYLLAEFYRIMEKPDKAEPLLQRAIETWSKTLAKDAPQIERAWDSYFCLLASTKQNRAGSRELPTIPARSLSAKRRHRSRPHRERPERQGDQ